MAANPPLRPFRQPQPDIASRPLPKTRQAPRTWFRVHQKRYAAAFFSNNPTHRYSHPDCPDSILYVGIDVETCLWECFGDHLFNNAHTIPLTAWEELMVSMISVPALFVCDLTNTATRGELAVDLAALTSSDLAIPQEWGLAVQKHPDAVSGIKFRSRFSNRACLAIFNRCGIPSRLQEKTLAELSTCDSALAWLTRHNVTLL